MDKDWCVSFSVVTVVDILCQIHVLDVDQIWISAKIFSVGRMKIINPASLFDLMSKAVYYFYAQMSMLVKSKGK